MILNRFALSAGVPRLLRRALELDPEVEVAADGSGSDLQLIFDPVDGGGDHDFEFLFFHN